MKILSFTHVVPNMTYFLLQNMKENIWRNFGNRAVSGPIGFYCIFFPYSASQREPKRLTLFFILTELLSLDGLIFPLSILLFASFPSSGMGSLIKRMQISQISHVIFLTLIPSCQGTWATARSHGDGNLRLCPKWCIFGVYSRWSFCIHKTLKCLVRDFRPPKCGFGRMGFGTEPLFFK